MISNTIYTLLDILNIQKLSIFKLRYLEKDSVNLYTIIYNFCFLHMSWILVFDICFKTDVKGKPQPPTPPTIPAPAPTTPIPTPKPFPPTSIPATTTTRPSATSAPPTSHHKWSYSGDTGAKFLVLHMLFT